MTISLVTMSDLLASPVAWFTAAVLIIMLLSLTIR